MVTVNEDKANWLGVREGPSVDYPVVDKIYKGEEYELIEETERWYKIKLEEGAEVWAPAYYTNKIIVKNE